MDPEQFVERLRAYLDAVLQGLCEDKQDIKTAVLKDPGSGRVSLGAWLSERDTCAIRDLTTGVYIGLKNILARCGQVYLNPSNRPYLVDFTLYDPIHHQEYAASRSVALWEPGPIGTARLVKASKGAAGARPRAHPAKQGVRRTGRAQA
jgi:hypothetical protein